MNNAAIVSGGQQRDSAIQILDPFSLKLRFHLTCHITLNRIPHAIK